MRGARESRHENLSHEVATAYSCGCKPADTKHSRIPSHEVAAADSQLRLGNQYFILPSIERVSSKIHSLALRACILVFAVLCGSYCSAQEIILRDLTRIREIPVAKIDVAYLYLTNGQKLTWDRILQAHVDEKWQESLDSHVKRIGVPLYRLKHRLSQQNIYGAFEIAKDWYENESKSFAGDEANFLVSRAVMLGRIRRGERARAVEPMILATQRQEKCSESFLKSFASIAFERDELRTAICDELLPVWNSVDEIQSELDSLSRRFELTSLVKKWPGLAVYLSSMAVYIDQRQRMTDWNFAMGSVPQLRQWQRVLGSDLARTPLSRLIDRSEGPFRVTVMYWWATTSEQRASKRQRVLALLKIAANYGDQFPILSKEALSQAAALTDDPVEQIVIEKALRQ